MDSLRTIALILAIAAIGIGAFLYASYEVKSPTDTWQVKLADPIVIGNDDDRFAYAGGPLVREVSGSGRLSFSPEKRTGSIRIDFTDPEGDGEWTGRNDLRSRLNGTTKIDSNVEIDGETGLGEVRLPQSHAYLAGMSDFTVYSGLWPVGRVRGFWSLAYAIRKEDGSIRNQGLVYSPLLRDKTVFSDPTRLEFTLILYEDDEVLLDLVFRKVTIVRSPEGEDLP
ncbi:MAG TPA: hypothetical protein ENJ47_02605 [Candidatus Acetothermia bacterium]|nr:hypothetical protein [Candidatus Acetothermia bacterium]